MRMRRMMTAGTMALGAYRMYKTVRGRNGASTPARGRFGRTGGRTTSSRGTGGLFGRR